MLKLFLLYSFLRFRTNATVLYGCWPSADYCLSKPNCSVTRDFGYQLCQTYTFQQSSSFKLHYFSWSLRMLLAGLIVFGKIFLRFSCHCSILGRNSCSQEGRCRKDIFVQSCQSNCLGRPTYRKFSLNTSQKLSPWLFLGCGPMPVLPFFSYCNSCFMCCLKLVDFWCTLFAFYLCTSFACSLFSLFFLLWGVAWYVFKEMSHYWKKWRGTCGSVCHHGVGASGILMKAKKSEANFWPHKWWIARWVLMSMSSGEPAKSGLCTHKFAYENFTLRPCKTSFVFNLEAIFWLDSHSVARRLKTTMLWTLSLNFSSPK